MGRPSSFPVSIHSWMMLEDLGDSIAEKYQELVRAPYGCEGGPKRSAGWNGWQAAPFIPPLVGTGEGGVFDFPRSSRSTLWYRDFPPFRSASSFLELRLLKLQMRCLHSGSIFGT